MQVETLRLGTQTNKGCTVQDVHWKSLAWMPKKARSYTITNFRHTDYHGRTMDHETGYSSFTVTYYSTVREGEHVIPRQTLPRGSYCNWRPDAEYGVPPTIHRLSDLGYCKGWHANAA